MDARNRFHSRGTYTLVRMEWVVGLVVCTLLGFLHIDSIDWARYLVLFIGIDLVGTLPGTIAHKRAGGRRVAPIHYYLYNVTHSAVFMAGVALLWSLTLGPEWALLALPTHLCGDRGLFGNVFKPQALPFEPTCDVRGAEPPRFPQMPQREPGHAPQRSRVRSLRQQGGQPPLSPGMHCVMCQPAEHPERGRP